MKVDVGIATVSSAGTAVQALNATNRVKYAKFKALAGNSGLAYVGVSDVSASIGYELSAGNELEWNFGEFGGSVPANVFYVDAATNNDKVSWTMILEG
jgi:hypothetical protein|tara:strand:+ start:673 stop:966 length:294 start_codon:yes stop_codon:yes gene_type:complete